ASMASTPLTQSQRGVSWLRSSARCEGWLRMCWIDEGGRAKVAETSLGTGAGMFFWRMLTLKPGATLWFLPGRSRMLAAEARHIVSGRLPIFDIHKDTRIHWPSRQIRRK